MRVAVVACALIALVPYQTPKPSLPTEDPCFRPLEEFCARNACATYAEQVKTMRGSGNCSATSFGRCGTLRITYTSNPFTAETRYFDKGGKLIAARAERDVYVRHLACPYWTHYGAQINCRVTNVKLCKPL